MSSLRDIYIVGGDKDYACWMEGTVIDNMENADIVVFTGGEDVSPELYGEEPHPMTFNDPHRDRKEVAEWRKAMEMKIPMVGICRGAQFLCVMAGGKLVQHQENPRSMHMMETYDGHQILVTSTHHQAQYPWGLGEDDFRVLGWTSELSSYHEGENKRELVHGVVKGNIEVEVCHYPHIRALGIQPHPEIQYLRGSWTKDTVKTINYFRSMLDMFLTEFPNAD